MILREMHNVPYVEHPGYQKTIAYVKSQYYWPGMKKEVVDFIAKCLECQKVKAKHRHPVGFLQPLLILEWKWEVVTMYFITNGTSRSGALRKLIFEDTCSQVIWNFVMLNHLYLIMM